MTAEQLWSKFAEKNGIKHNEYEAWQFGGAPDKLAELVLRGIKTGTASAEELYKIDNEPIPTEGEYSVILNSRDEAVCVIRTTKVSVVPFCDVSAHHAFCEGEGDRSLAYWRKVHEEFFRDEYVAHVVDKKCPAGVCKSLLHYEIVADKCKGCTLCARNCPVGAISGTVREPHVIDTQKCIKCGVCREKCKFGAIEKK